MAENSVKLTPEIIQTMSELTNVRRISDLNTIKVYDNTGTEIRTSREFENSYLLSSTYLEDRYYNYRVKLNELTNYIHDVGLMDVTVFRETFDFFIQSLRDNTVNSYVKFVPANEEINEEDPNSNYSYTFKYQLSSIKPESYFPFSYNDGEDSTYAYTNRLTDGIVTSYVLEEYIRETLGRILGVPSTPAYISEAIDSVIEFVDWFKGYVRNDTSYGSLHQLISTIEAKDSAILNEAKSYTVENKELSYAYVESSYNLLYNTIQDIDVDLAGGTNIDIGENNTINCYIGIDSLNNTLVINGTQYSLTLNANGKLGFTQYTSMEITDYSGGGTLEIDSTAQPSNLTFKCITNNDINTATWSGGSETVTTNGKTTQITVTQNGNNEISRTCTVTDNTGHDDSETIKLQFTSKRYFLGWSTNPNLEFANCNNGTNIASTNNYNNFKDSLSTSDIYKKGFTGNGFWYMIWPTTVSISNIFFGSGTQKAPAPGGWHEHFVFYNNGEIDGWHEGDAAKATDNGQTQMTVNQYSTIEKYYVYRSDNPFSGQMNIQF